MKSRYLAFLLVFAVLFIGLGSIQEVSAQCAMCSLTAENSTIDGNNQGKGLNDGILFLLAIPYLIAAGIGILWYKKYRKTKVRQIFPTQE
ncbi:hypothetical protein [Sphingobacterium sp. MYb382]|uniref:hypothetical protein n=1 Tax=Sphingobacterium sp. MYb382 TaxID=2745278 RepID=UPI0030B07DA2